MPVLEAVKSPKWGAGSPTVVTYIHKLSRPPPLPGSLLYEGGRGGGYPVYLYGLYLVPHSIKSVGASSGPI